MSEGGGYAPLHIMTQNVHFVQNCVNNICLLCKQQIKSEKNIYGPFPFLTLFIPRGGYSAPVSFLFTKF